MARKKKGKDVFKTALVEKRNVLNELRSNNMTLQELRFFSIYLSKINARDVSTRVVRFPLSDFQRIMELGADMNIAHFKTTVRHILQQVVEIPNEKGGYTAFQLFKQAEIERDEQGEWYVEFDAHDKALPLMFEFKREYFTYELWNALRLKSANQVRMYEVLKQWEKVGKKEFKVAELRELLGIAPTEYTRWERFKVRVLDSCQQALKETTDIKFTYERGKVGKGGKWLTIVFHIEKNEDYIDQLTLDEFIEQQPAAVIDVSDTEAAQLEGQMSFDELLGADEPSEVEPPEELDEDEKLLAIYGNENMVEYARACSFEFDKDQMNVIFGHIRDLPIPPDKVTNSLLFGRVFWLTDMYNAFLVAIHQAELFGKPVKSRFKYFCRMVENKGKEMKGE